jgi:hypothetical protein
VNRALPLWPYSASDNVNRARNSEPGKMSINLCMQFVDFWWRFATVAPQEIALRLWENVANGGALAFEVNGTLDQQDRQAIGAAKPIFQWLAENERFYARQHSAARVLLLGGSAKTGHPYSQDSYRGLFRLLSEEHVPFAVSDNMDWLGKRQFDLVVASDWAPQELTQYVESGGRLVVVSPHQADFPIAPVLRTWQDMKGYFRVRDHAQFPSLNDTDLLMIDGPYTEVASNGTPALTLVPPSLIGPPELVHVDMQDTNKPGLIFANKGAGSVAWIPWDLAGLYYRESLPAHAALFRDVMDRLNPHRQLVTNAHPLIEITWMEQDGRQLLHFVNLSGHSQTGYFDPVPMNNIRVRVAGTFNHARTLRTPADLPVTVSGGYSEFTIPRLLDYEMVVVN